MRMVDLTHPLHEKTPAYFPWHPKTEMRQTASYEKESCMVHRLTIGTHTGTHIDAPSHFFQGHTTIDCLPLYLLISEAQVVRVLEKEPREPITREDIETRGIREGVGVILHTGWSVHHGRPDYYQTYPPLSDEAGEFLIACNVPYLAADTPFSVGVHKIMLGGGRPLITNLNNLEQLRRDRVRLYAFPLKILGMDGSPARVLAEEEE